MITIVLCDRDDKQSTYYTLEIENDDIKHIKKVINEAMTRLASDLLSKERPYKEILRYKNGTGWLIEPLKIFNPKINKLPIPPKINGKKLELKTIHDLKQINQTNAKFLIKLLSQL